VALDGGPRERLMCSPGRNPCWASKAEGKSQLAPRAPVYAVKAGTCITGVEPCPQQRLSHPTCASAETILQARLCRASSSDGICRLLISSSHSKRKIYKPVLSWVGFSGWDTPALVGCKYVDLRQLIGAVLNPLAAGLQPPSAETFQKTARMLRLVR
jgi:hypothetical protein